MNEDGRLSSPSSAPEAGILPWQQGWKALRSTWTQLVYISTVSIAIPQSVLYWIQSQSASEVGASFQFSENVPMLVMMDRLKSYLFSYGFTQILCFFVATIGYLSLVELVAQYHQQGRSNLRGALSQGFRSFVPRGLFALFFVLPVALILTSLALMPHAGLLIQYVIISFFVLLAALPVLIAKGGLTSLEAFKQTIRLSYAEGSGYSRWSVFFVLLAYDMGLFAALYILDFCHERLNQLDQIFGFPRDAWFWASKHFPFGIIPFALETLMWLLSSLVLGAFAIFTSSFILELIRRKAEVGPPKPQLQAWV